ncbi:hypothetical protein KFK09_025531 [Dendrobium nobile]|uniref:Uncharacterized protein n=1 Tax=Dendrobium nobile TaxID=94219 RepID=A0A8T3AH73_DENNO|nr:hypothetical protein KFK09_025531 [Dendrobium nobile]
MEGIERTGALGNTEEKEKRIHAATCPPQLGVLSAYVANGGEGREDYPALLFELLIKAKLEEEKLTLNAS